jgi:DNA polymerase delta subunit 1
MVRFNVPDKDRYNMHVHFEIAQRIAEQISATFPGCIELEFEKCYYPYLLYSKKRYAGLMFTNPDKADYVDVKGLQLVRRDNAKIVKQISQGILDTIMYEKSADGAINVARDLIRRMLQGELEIDQFIVSKSLRGSYANPNAQPHVQVARKIRERTGQVLESGSRVPYVFVVDDHIDQKISCRAEDPVYAQEHGLELDFLYYLDNQIMSPVTAMLEVLVEDPAGMILCDPEIARLLTQMRDTRTHLLKTVKRVKTNTKNRQMEITSFFK